MTSSHESRILIARALARVWSAMGLEPADAGLEEYIRAVQGALDGARDPGQVLAATIDDLINTWTPPLGRRLPVPAEIRRAVFDARRSEVRALTEREQTHRALPMSEAERLERASAARQLVDELAAKLNWSPSWREEARDGSQDRSAQKVKELLAEARAAHAQRSAAGRRKHGRRRA